VVLPPVKEFAVQRGLRQATAKGYADPRNNQSQFFGQHEHVRRVLVERPQRQRQCVLDKQSIAEIAGCAQVALSAKGSDEQQRAVGNSSPSMQKPAKCGGWAYVIPDAGARPGQA
jgi:hypothetical protein